MKNIRHQNLGLRALAMTLAFLLTMPAHAGDVVTYVHADHLGSPVAATNSLGQVTRNQVYSPYGETHLSADGDTAGFTGHRNDADTGLVYMQARYYDPISGRFLSTDPVTFSADRPAYFNRYWYAGGNPVKYVDPDGQCFGMALIPCAVAAATVLVVAYAVVRIDQAYEENEPNFQEELQEIQSIDGIQERLDNKEINPLEALKEQYESDERRKKAAESSREIATELGSELQPYVPTPVGVIQIADDAADGDLQDSKSPLQSESTNDESKKNDESDRGGPPQ